MHLPAYVCIIRLHLNSKDRALSEHIGRLLDDPGLIHFDFNEGLLVRTEAIYRVLIVDLSIMHKLNVLTKQIVLDLRQSIKTGLSH